MQSSSYLRRLAAPALLLALFGVGCRHAAATAGTGSAESGTSSDPDPALAPPPGFFRVEVLGVIPGPEGHALFLVEPLKRRLLPIWIGPAEAMSIRLRLDRRRFERPLTHDLIDRLLEHFDARVREVRIDAVNDGTFVSTLTLESARGLEQMDVRPSDGVALAIGARAPIFVARQVLDRASLSADELQGDPSLLLPGSGSESDAEPAPLLAPPAAPAAPPVGQPL